MLYDYINETYENGEPIFLAELPKTYSRTYIQQEMKRLTDEGKLNRFCNGVYYRTYTTILGTNGKISIEKYVQKKYLSNNGKSFGYKTGLQFANEIGLTTQNSAYYEVCSNKATTKQRKFNTNGMQIIAYKPVTLITEKNKTALQFLDLMSVIDKYSEVSKTERFRKLKEYVNNSSLDFKEVKNALPLYPDKVYKNIYEEGLMYALV